MVAVSVTGALDEEERLTRIMMMVALPEQQQQQFHQRRMDSRRRRRRLHGKIILVIVALIFQAAITTALLPYTHIKMLHNNIIGRPIVKVIPSFLENGSTSGEASTSKAATATNPRPERSPSDMFIASLDRFVSQVDQFNDGYHEERVDPPIRIISRGSNTIPPHCPVRTIVYFQPKSTRVVMAMLSSTSSSIDSGEHHVDLSKIQALLGDDGSHTDDTIFEVPSDDVQALCGFPLETLPPIGYSLADHVSSLLLVIDQSLFENCQNNNKLMFLCGAGYPYWQSLLDPKSIQPLPNIRVADILVGSSNGDSEFGGDINGQAVDMDKVATRVWPSSSNNVKENRPASKIATKVSTASDPSPSSLKPTFPIDGPPIHLARILVRQKDISNPLLPTYVTAAVGRIGKIIVKTKRSLCCEFLPPTKELPHRLMDHESFPWRSPRDGIDLKVELSIGKSTKGGEGIIQIIEEGQLIQINGRTNPGRRESLSRWVDMQCLDLDVIDCQLIEEVGNKTPLEGNNPSNDGGIVDTVKDTRRSSAPTSTSHVLSLTLHDVFNCTNGKLPEIIVVNTFDTIASFSSDMLILTRRTQNHQELNGGTKNLISCSVGIDCEWQPTEFTDLTSHNNKLPIQNVLLLQISMNVCDRVYLFDLQTLLRPQLQPDNPMNELEQAVSDCLGQLMISNDILKVGYQLPSDLRRIVASYPHLPCFREVHSVLEVASLIKRILHVSKQKRSRYITLSLTSMALHYLGGNVAKEQQMSNWADRPLSPSQLEYAALDAAIAPVLAQRAIQSIDARICLSGNSNTTGDDSADLEEAGPPFGPFLERWDSDTALRKEITSWRFQFLGEDTDDNIVSALQAKQVVGSSWIASQSWISSRQRPPSPLL